MLEQEIYTYCEQHSDPQGEVLTELVRQTHLRVVNPRMLSGHLQGRFLRMLVQMLGAQRVLEIGTFTGYATICMAQGLPEDGGELITLEINDELDGLSTEFFERSGLAHKITQIIGDAVQTLRNLSPDKPFDMVFVDADKRQYADYYNALFVQGLVRSGSLIVADNTLWAGKVIEKNHRPSDRQTHSLLQFNDMVATDQRVERVLLPLRDGLTLIRVK